MNIHWHFESSLWSHADLLCLTPLSAPEPYPWGTSAWRVYLSWDHGGSQGAESGASRHSGGRFWLAMCSWVQRDAESCLKVIWLLSSFLSSLQAFSTLSFSWESGQRQTLATGETAGSGRESRRHLNTWRYCLYLTWCGTAALIHLQAALGNVSFSAFISFLSIPLSLTSLQARGVADLQFSAACFKFREENDLLRCCWNAVVMHDLFFVWNVRLCVVALFWPICCSTSKPQLRITFKKWRM